MKKLLSAMLLLLVSSSVQAVFCHEVDFSVFNIRNNNGSITEPWDNDMSIIENAEGDGFSAATPRASQKVGYGTNAFDGMAVNTINTANWNTVVNDTGKNIVPYINMWVTDGTHYAIISSENDYRGTDFLTRQEWKIFEYENYNDIDWLFDSGTGARDTAQYLTLNGTRVTLSDFSDSIVLGSPLFPAEYDGVGYGAPRANYGFNILMGDTMANYIGGFTIADMTITIDETRYCVTPEPATLGVLALGGIMAIRRRRA
ncbi:MAG: PEP-CTERM sorting domain-containing protein [Sedimentisphaerales bacterium]|nr:PEP-CTERM sorting domain-containing protein [Sedimentisphaerales bacterium]MBN2841654.1 PEP-CTERM sorting domain-containing protein [Sedimentisphaerales bacterium]